MHRLHAERISEELAEVKPLMACPYQFPDNGYPQVPFRYFLLCKPANHKFQHIIVDCRIICYSASHILLILKRGIQKFLT